MLDAQTWQDLVAAAETIASHAYAPYSNFKVGAALLTDDRIVYAGCNVENASYGLCLCAERAAIAQAVAAGKRNFAAIAIVTPGQTPGLPCGMCLQVMAEFCRELPILLVCAAGLQQQTQLSALLPTPFRL